MPNIAEIIAQAKLLCHKHPETKAEKAKRLKAEAKEAAQQANRDEELKAKRKEEIEEKREEIKSLRGEIQWLRILIEEYRYNHPIQVQEIITTPEPKIIIAPPESKQLVKIIDKSYSPYNNLRGYRKVLDNNGFIVRSKIELYIEDALIDLYPDLDIIFNDRVALGRKELDIYIPSLKLAFELNGGVHKATFFKGAKIIKQDKLKLQLCNKLNIDLHVIDTDHSFSKKLKRETLQYIVDSINYKMSL